jgi:hypothetical protein
LMREIVAAPHTITRVPTLLHPALGFAGGGRRHRRTPTGVRGEIMGLVIMRTG